MLTIFSKCYGDVILQPCDTDSESEDENDTSDKPAATPTFSKYTPLPTVVILYLGTHPHWCKSDENFR